MSRIWNLPVVVALCAAGCESGTDGGPSAPVAAATMDIVELALAQDVFDRVNQVRLSRNVAPLSWHFTASQVAFEHSLDMRVRGFFGHINA